jgi:hypothetical protein
MEIEELHVTSGNDWVSKARLAFLAGSTLTLSVCSSIASAESASFKANFNLHAESAIVSKDSLKLSGVSPFVFVAESGSDAAYGVTESTTFFLERWRMLEHDIRPHGILFTSSKLHDAAYLSLRFDIDNPSQLGDGSADWVFEIDHVDDAADSFQEARLIEPIMLTIVMEHTQEEVAEGRVCGPWDVSDLRTHHELIEE